MSLDYDLRGLNPEKRAKVFPPDEDGLMNDHLHVLIFMTMNIGISRIHPSNVDEVWRRVDMFQRIYGTGWQRVERVDPADESSPAVATPVTLSPEHIIAAIGLRTNAAPLTPSEFLKNLYDRHPRVFPLDRSMV